MPGKGIMFRIPILTIVLALAAGSAALGQTLPPQPPPPALPGSEEERAACKPDVMKFCKNLLPDDPNAQPDTFAIANCLQSQSGISAACGRVLTGHSR